MLFILLATELPKNDTSLDFITHLTQESIDCNTPKAMNALLTNFKAIPWENEEVTNKFFQSQELQKDISTIILKLTEENQIKIFKSIKAFEYSNFVISTTAISKPITDFYKLFKNFVFENLNTLENFISFKISFSEYNDSFFLESVPFNIADLNIVTEKLLPFLKKNSNTLQIIHLSNLKSAEKKINDKIQKKKIYDMSGSFMDTLNTVEFPHLVDLSFSNNFIENDRMCHLPKEFPSTLQKLDLSNNSFYDFDRPDSKFVTYDYHFSFSNLKHLTHLNLSNTEIRTLPSSFEHLTNLQVINLSNNEITKFPFNFNSFSKLQSLDLHNNKIISFDELNLPSSLQNLNLSSNQIPEISTNISALTQLQSLDLGYNKLTEIPFEIFLLPKLEFLRFSENRITKLPTQILFDENISYSLRQLHLSGNDLEFCPNWIGTVFISLELLSLNSMYIKKIPENICDLPKLKNFSIYWNFLIELPTNFWKLKNILTATDLERIKDNPCLIILEPPIEYDFQI